jgi:pimeloyl-ACP methyl ester carboxylesterase
MTFRRMLLIAVLLYAVGLPFYNDHEHRTLDDRARAGMPGRFVTLTGGTTHYDTVGPEDGETVVFVHGFSMPAFVWGRLPGELAERGYRTIRYDLFGRGLSDRPEAVYDLTLYRDQLTGLLNALDIDKPFHLVGLSMGGAIAVDYAAAFPRRLASLTLIAPAGFPVDTPAIASLVKVPWVGEYLMKLAGDRLLTGAISRSVADDSLVPELERGFREQLQWKGYKRAILSTLRHTPLEDLGERYRRFGRNKVPTLLFWGTEDEVLPLQNAAFVRYAVPDLTLIRVDGAGHLPQFEAPEVVVPAMANFLRANPVEVPEAKPARGKAKGRTDAAGGKAAKTPKEP